MLTKKARLVKIATRVYLHTLLIFVGFDEGIRQRYHLFALLECRATVACVVLVDLQHLRVGNDRPDHLRDGGVVDVVAERQRAGDNGPCTCVTIASHMSDGLY